MRLYHFINESPFRFEELDLFPEELAITIKRDCKKYLKETKGYWFQRGMELRLDPKVPGGYRKTRQDRRPLGMDKNLFDKFNKWLIKSGHMDRSKSVICSTIARRLFGLPYYIFIEGDYKYTWVDSNDINTDTDDTGWYSSIVDEYLNMKTYEDDFWGTPYLRKQKDHDLEQMGKTEISIHDKWIKADKNHNERVKKWLKENFKHFFHTNKGMKTAWDNNYEIWFQCKGYYFIRTDNKVYYNKIKRIVK